MREIRTQFVAKCHGETIGYFDTREEADAALDAALGNSDALPEGWKRIGDLRKFERFVFTEGDAIEYRVERHTDDAVWASWMQGGVWGTQLKGFACSFPVRVIGGAR